MSVIKKIAREIAGLFVDDEFLAVGTVAVVGITAILLRSRTAAVAGEMTLLGGCLAALVVSVWRGARAANRAAGRVLAEPDRDEP